MNKTGMVIAMWGVVLLVAWGYPAYGKVPLASDFVWSMLYWWGLLMAVALALTYAFFPKPFSNKVVLAFSAIVVLGMVSNFLAGTGVLPKSYGPWLYYNLWLLLGAAGFFFAAFNWLPRSRNIYLAAGVLNLLAFLLYTAGFLVTRDNRLVVAAAVQGLPPLVDGLLNYK